MEQRCQDFDAVNQPRAGTTKIGRCIDEECVLCQVGRQAPLAPLLDQLLQLFVCPSNGKPTRHYDQNVWSHSQYLVPRHNSRGTAGLREDISASSKLDHFRDPMSCDIERREPFDAYYARAMRDALGARINCIESVT